MRKKEKLQKPIAAFIFWEDRFRGELNYGTVKILMDDASVWEVTVYRGKEDGGPTKFKKFKRRQRLTALKTEWRRDLEGMAQTWRAMIFNQDKGYELASPVFLELITENYCNTIKTR